ncbi:2-dehydropantoate 2-reductase [bacterium]|nr:2-dehydropantoate 2-reductase [bacterium]
MSIQSIYLFGVGGVGGYIGCRIVQATEKNPNIKTYFIARGAHRDTINKNGLILETAGETFTAHPALATEDLTNIPSPDLCILCVKSYDLEGACEKLKSKVHHHTAIIPVLNGVDIYERIRAIIKTGYVLPGCVYMGAFIKQPGVVRHLDNDLVIYGRDPKYHDRLPSEAIEFLNTISNMRFQFRDDPYPAIWEKYMFVAAYALATAHSRQTIRYVHDHTELKNIVMAIISEIKCIAEKKGFSFSADIVEKLAARGGKLQPEAQTSYQRDMATNHGRNEGDIFGETILRLGRELNVPTPVTKKICDEIG